MSERKTDEIKFRVEPSVKARWERAADREQIGLSEFIRRAAEREANPITVLDPDTSTFQTLLSATGRASFSPVENGGNWKPYGADSFA